MLMRRGRVGEANAKMRWRNRGRIGGIRGEWDSVGRWRLKLKVGFGRYLSLSRALLSPLSSLYLLGYLGPLYFIIIF